MVKNKALRYTLFGLLYFSQGTVLGYFTALNALYLLSRNVSMTDVGIFALIAMIPFVIKIFLGMLSDNVNLLGLGHRKPYILLGLTIQIACLIVAPLIDPALYYWEFVALAFVLQLGMALYDTCTDGLALDTTPEEEQSTIQGFMVGGRAMGVIIAASAAGLLAEFSWPAVFWSLAGLSLLPIPLVLGMREAARPKDRAFDWKAFRAFRQRRVLAVTGLGFVFFVIIAGANQNVNPFFEQAFGIELSTAGLLATVWGIGVVLGGTVGATLMRRIGRRDLGSASALGGLADRTGADAQRGVDLAAGSLVRALVRHVPDAVLCPVDGLHRQAHRRVDVLDPDGNKQRGPRRGDGAQWRAGRQNRLPLDLRRAGGPQCAGPPADPCTVR